MLKILTWFSVMYLNYFIQIFGNRENFPLRKLLVVTVFLTHMVDVFKIRLAT